MTGHGIAGLWLQPWTAGMTMLSAVVPVLLMSGQTGGLPVASVRLHGRPLFVHAARTLSEVAGPGTVVSAPPGGRHTVLAALAADGLEALPVFEGGDTLGEVLTRVLASGGRRAPRRAASVLVHDPRCPLVPASYLRDVMAAAETDRGAVLMATRPMTDTVKSVIDGVVQATVDRDLLRVLTSPLVLPAALLHDLVEAGGLQQCGDVDDLVDLARAAGARVRWVPAPSMASRVSDAAAVSVLECLTEVRAGSRS